MRGREGTGFQRILFLFFGISFPGESHWAGQTQFLGSFRNSEMMSLSVQNSTFEHFLRTTGLVKRGVEKLER
jgi:hypothetical protein